MVAVDDLEPRFHFDHRPIDRNLLRPDRRVVRIKRGKDVLAVVGALFVVFAQHSLFRRPADDDVSRWGVILAPDDHGAAFGNVRAHALAAHPVGDVFTHLLGRFQLRAVFVLLSCETHTPSAAYTLFIETTESPFPEMAQTPDDASRENVHYDLCRRLDQLVVVRVVRVIYGLEAYTRHLHTLGQRLGDVKPQVLSARRGWLGVFHTRMWMAGIKVCTVTRRFAELTGVRSWFAPSSVGTQSTKYFKTMIRLCPPKACFRRVYLRRKGAVFLRIATVLRFIPTRRCPHAKKRPRAGSAVGRLWGALPVGGSGWSGRGQ